MVKFDPETSYGKIVRFNKQNPDEYKTVGRLIQGQEAIIKKLLELRRQEPDREKWGYYWKWVKRANGKPSKNK